MTDLQIRKCTKVNIALQFFSSYIYFQELLFLSNYFDVPSLKEACKKFMSEKLSSKNVFLYLEEALNMRVESMVDECLEIIRVNRNLFTVDGTFKEVTLQQMERILASEALPITEEHLFNFVVEWTKRLANAGPQLEKMFKLIRLMERESLYMYYHKIKHHKITRSQDQTLD